MGSVGHARNVGTQVLIAQRALPPSPSGSKPLVLRPIGCGDIRMSEPGRTIAGATIVTSPFRKKRRLTKEEDVAEG